MLTVIGLFTAAVGGPFDALDNFRKRKNYVQAHVLSGPFTFPPGMTGPLPDVKGYVLAGLLNYGSAELKDVKVKIPKVRFATPGTLDPTTGWLTIPSLMPSDTINITAWTADVPSVYTLELDMTIAYDGKLGAVWVYYPDAGPRRSDYWTAVIMALACIGFLIQTHRIDVDFKRGMKEEFEKLNDERRQIEQIRKEADERIQIAEKWMP